MAPSPSLDSLRNLYKISIYKRKLTYLNRVFLGYYYCYTSLSISLHHYPYHHYPYQHYRYHYTYHFIIISSSSIILRSTWGILFELWKFHWRYQIFQKAILILILKLKPFLKLILMLILILIPYRFNSNSILY